MLFARSLALDLNPSIQTMASMLGHDSKTASGPSGHAFVTTRWSVVWQARRNEPIASADAREKLCRIYWPPLYAYIRRSGYSRADAQDLTQEFLNRFLEKEWINHLRDQRGKFRSFLLTFLKNFLSDERDRAHALKRGGGKQIISLDAWQAEDGEPLGPVDSLTADQIYDRRWACAVMAEAISRLEAEYAGRGRLALFARLKELHPGEHGDTSYADLAAAFGMTVQAIKSARHSFNRRYAELIREEIAQTLADPADLAAEVQHLLQAFSR